ncbi:restriction endonuclease [Streptomyces sp. NPDC004682]
MRARYVRPTVVDGTGVESDPGEATRSQAMVWGQELVTEFQQLGAMSSAHRRGLALEKMLERLFQRAHFRVQRNAGVAKPRQTDLLAGYGESRYVIEAKWEKSPVGVNTFDTVRARMERAVPNTVGVIVSISGFTDTVIKQVVEYRGRQPILLIGERELLQAFRAPHSLSRMLRSKWDELAIHGRAHLDEEPRRAVRQRPVTDLPAAGSSLLGTDLEPLPYVASRDTFAELAFVPELPDVDWVAAGGSGVSLDLPVRQLDEGGLIDLVHTLSSMGWTTSDPSWSIRQATTAWHGRGAREFVDAVTSWRKRYRGLDKNDVHHTEQVTYFDTCEGGGFYTLSADISSDRSRVVYRSNVSFQLAGIPVDTQPLRHLVEEYDATVSSFFRPLSERAVTREVLPVRSPLEHVGYVVSSEDFGDLADDGQVGTPGDSVADKWVTGIVARNPYYSPDRDAAPDGWPGEATSSELLICALRSHHPLAKIPDSYVLDSWEVARTSDAAVLRLVADW